MTTIRDNYLMAAKGGKPYWVPSFTDDCNMFFPDYWFWEDPETGTDFFNIKWTANDAGRMPLEGWHAMEHISQWRETVKFPDPSKLDWEGMTARAKTMGSPDKVNVGMLNTSGIFLIPVNMLGWVEALCAIHEDPEELEAFICAITDFLCETMKYMGKYFHPDIVCTGDDVASANGPFLSKEVWDGMYRPYFRRLCDAIHSEGALAEFHCCGNCGWMIEEFLNVGADICQLPEPNKSLLEDKRRFGARLVITGGWDRHGPGSMPDASEEAVRRSVRDGIDTWGRDGALIFWDGGIVGSGEDANNKRRWVADELKKYGSTVYG